MRPNNICCIGGNRMGGLLCCAIALKCPEVRVNVVDNEKIIAQWNSDDPPFKDETVCKILKQCRNRNLFFSSDYSTFIKEADLIYVPLNATPRTDIPGKQRALDFRDLEEAGKLIAAHSESSKIVVEKSTVSARALERISAVLESYSKVGVRYQVLSNPELVTEGPAINDFLDPKCVLIGYRKNRKSKEAIQSLCELYKHWVPRDKIQVLKSPSLEITVLAWNVLLAQKIASLNALTIICEETGTDVTVVTRIFNTNSPLQTDHVNLGSFQKHVASLVLTCETFNLHEAASYWQAVTDMQNFSKTRFIDKVKTILDPIENKDVTILGFAQEKNTSETKFSPAIELCVWLLERNCSLRIYDPVVPPAQIARDLKLDLIEERRQRVHILNDVHFGTGETSVIFLCTNWDEFVNLDYSKVFRWNDKLVLIDGHRCLNGDAIRSLGIDYHAVGMPNAKDIL